MRTNWNTTLRTRQAATIASCQAEEAPTLDQIPTDQFRARCTAAGIPWVGKKRAVLEQLLAEAEGAH